MKIRYLFENPSPAAPELEEQNLEQPQRIEQNL
jgi:hypothetical protein